MNFIGSKVAFKVFVIQVITGIFFLFSILLCSTNSNGQEVQWIDKNESEEYVARHECSFVQAGDKFVLFGGRESAQRLDMYDYKTNSWSTGASAPKEFNHFQATFYKGFIWVIGSFKTNQFPREIPADYIWLYHVAGKKWIQGPQIPEDRRRGGAGLVVYDDKFYVLGGNTIGHDGGFVNWFDEYDPKLNTWTTLEDASEARDHFSAAVINNTLYAAGGRQSGREGGFFQPLVAAVETYNFKTKTWSILKDEIPTPRAAPGVAVFNGELLVMGGEGEEKGAAYKLVEAYNPTSDQWCRKVDMHYPRHGTQAILSGNGIYITAGSPVRGGGKQHNMEVYNEDKPDGFVIVASELVVPELVSIKKGTSKEIQIENKGGNSGTFINSVEIKGIHKNSFVIKKAMNLTLLNPNVESAIEVEHVGNGSNETAMLCITYNGDVEKKCTLTSK